jgi:hypothetical protein
MGAETTSSKKKFDVNKLFQGPSASSSSAPPPPSPSANAHPVSHPRRLSVTESKIPASPQQRAGLLPGGGQPYSPYPTQAGPHMRPPQQSASPRSPQFPRGMLGGAPGPGVNGNGQGRGGPPLQSGPGPGPGPGGPLVGSPRLGPQPMPQQQPQQQPMPMQMPPQGWGPPYYVS